MKVSENFEFDLCRYFVALIAGWAKVEDAGHLSSGESTK